jgi:pimeloyl-ACP methyl ester carboxylesterase
LDLTANGYAHVNGLAMYYEVHGEGAPLVLLHGGVLTIDLSFGNLIPEFAADRKVIATELQGHGRTADTDHEVDLKYLASDVAGLLDHLGVERADVFGFSLGGGTALQFALDHPGRLRKLVVASAGCSARARRLPCWCSATTTSSAWSTRCRCAS